jgi:hypothetical protein
VAVYLFLGIALAIGAYLIAQGLVRTRPRQIVRVLKGLGLAAAAAAVVFLAITGRLSWALFLLPALLPWLLRARALHRTYKAARGPSPGQRSRVETPTLAMELDHDSGEMDGTILTGPMAGLRLADLDRERLVSFYRWCCNQDVEAARLLEAYLDRTLGADWRDADEAAADAGTRSGGPGRDGMPPPETMTAAEAYRIRGLEPGAGTAAIKAAHRRLMLHAHPDRGGSAYLAAKINAAKDFLLRS